MPKLGELGQWELDRCKDRLEQYRREINQRTALGESLDVLRWSDDFVESMALMTVLQQVQNSKSPPAVLKEWALDKALTMARNPQRSTSPMSNLAYQMECAAWARICLEFNAYVAKE
jgi:hypothetical protein